MSELQRKLDEIQKPIETNFRAGDTLSVHIKVMNKGKEVQKIVKGVCIRVKPKTFNIRKTVDEEEIELCFSNLVPTKVVVDRFGTVRRARIYYWRDLRGKKARIKENFKRKAASYANTKSAM